MSSEKESIEVRLQRVEDVLAIQRLFADYRRFLDGKEFEAYSQLFAKEGEFGAIAGGAKGPEAIREMVAGLVGTYLGESTGDDFHVMANEVIDLDIDGDHATAGSTWVYVVRGDDNSPQLAKIGHYNDRLVREDGRWKFEHREAPMDLST